MILNICLLGGSSAGKLNFSRHFTSLLDYPYSAFEIYNRPIPIDTSNDSLLNLKINQLLFDAILTNEQLKGIGHLYKSLKLVIHRDTPFEMVDSIENQSLSKIVRTEIEDVYERYPINIAFVLDGGSYPVKSNSVFTINGPIEAAEIVNGICDECGLEKYSGNATKPL